MSAVCALGLLATASCDSVIYDDELDCSTKIKFVFKKHRQALNAIDGKATDVFASTVGSVHLYIYDAETGELVFEKYEKTDNLKTESDLKIGTGNDKCYMAVDLEPGVYHLVAWCGLDEYDRNNAFSLGDGTRAGYAYSECSVRLAKQTGLPVNEAKYESVYHGAVEKAEVVLNYPSVIPVELTKDNNDITVWVQHNTETFAPGEYEVVFTDANTTMRYEDNVLMPTEPVEYRPYSTSLLESSTEFNGYPVRAGALVAHLSTSRLVDGHMDDATIEVRNREGRTIFSIPFIKYVLEMQTYTTNKDQYQYYLDCEDTYNCSFFFAGEEDEWVPVRIIINNWVIVPEQSGSVGGSGQ